MRHRVRRGKLNRDSAHRKAMFANMAAALIKHEQIATTLPKPQALRPVVEKLVTLRKHGGEFGTVTGRPRRCGWFDLPLSNYVHMVNGLTSIIVTKLDVLDHRETIPVCTGYRYQGETLSEMPALSRVLEKVEPVIEERPGWHCSTRGVKSYDELPQAAKDYLTYLEDKMEVEIGAISTGPERDETIIREGSKLVGLLV